MALIKCPECGRAVSDQASACPGCGHPIGGTVTIEKTDKLTKLIYLASALLAWPGFALVVWAWQFEGPSIAYLGAFPMAAGITAALYANLRDWWRNG